MFLDDGGVPKANVVLRKTPGHRGDKGNLAAVASWWFEIVAFIYWAGSGSGGILDYQNEP